MNDGTQRIIDGLAEIVSGGVRPDWATDAFCSDMIRQHTEMVVNHDSEIRGRAAEMMALLAQVRAMPETRQDGRADA